MLDGVRYFGPTGPNMALFVRSDFGDSIKPYNAEDEAAIRLQSQVRRKQGNESLKFTQSFKTFNDLESRQESEQLVNNARAASACNLIKDAESDGGMFGGSQTFKGGAASMTNTMFGATLKLPEVPQEPPVLGVPLLEFIIGEGGRASVTRENVTAVLRHFKKPNAEPLAAGCVAALIKHSTAMLRADVPYALQEVTTPPSPGRCIVLGDTHGQLQDVLWLFFEHGEPSPDNMYLFNGDVADRGNGATEIMTLILLFKLWDTRCMYMNRGNHEDPCMNETYGFQDECVKKWGPQRGGELFDAWNLLFQNLPLASVLDKEVFVVHGGLWRRDFRLTQLKRVAFRRPLPERPGVGLETIIFDSVWSDPHEGRGIGANPRGDVIVSFGPDVTRRFLKQEKLRLVVRSHQVPESGNGYEWHHSKKCITVFSASNYCGDAGNLGGALIFTKGEKDQLFEHWAPSLEELQVMEKEADRAQARIKAQARGMSSQRQFRKAGRERMEAECLRKVQELVVRRKSELFDYWAETDTSPRGVFSISAATWREGCSAVLDAGLPWVKLQDALGVVEDTGDVHYVKFLARYRAAFDAKYGLATAGWERAVWSKLMETLLRADLPLREALAALDATSDGLVSAVEFTHLIESCHVRITPLQARVLLRSVAANPSGAGDTGNLDLSASLGSTAARVSVWDMLQRLTVSLPVASHSSAEEASWAIPKLRPLATVIIADAWRRLVPEDAPENDWPVPKVLAAWFEEWDKSQNGYLEDNEFMSALTSVKAGLEKAGCPTDEGSLRRLTRCCDVVGNGHINYFELLNSLTWEDSLGDEIRADLMETMHAAIFFNMATIRSAMRKFDTQHVGLIAPPDFALAVRAVRTALTAAGEDESSVLGAGEVDEMLRNLPRNDGGLINYEDFLKSFRIIDTQAVDSAYSARAPSPGIEN